jgi:hypothetical protein
MPHVIFRSKYLFKKIMKTTHVQVRIFVSKPYFSAVSVHFYNLASMRNKGVCAPSVPFLVLLLFVFFFPVPVCAITASEVPGGTFVSMNHFSTLCG